jgi:uncharacterized protein YdaU (DUF1376 family)
VKKEFYQHYITDWMDSTEGLDDGAYRVYHVIIQMIYQHGGPIKLSERGLAGRCNQARPTFRKNLETLISLGKLKRIDDKITNKRAQSELERREEVSKNKAEAGKLSGASRRKTLTDQEKPRTDVHPSANEEKREEENREEKNLFAPDGAEKKRATRLPAGWMPTMLDRDRARQALGRNYERELEKFRNYWESKSGKDATKVDWDKTWLNWIMKAEENGHGAGQKSGRRGGSLLDAIDRALEKTEADLEASRDPLLRLPRGPVRQ